MVAPQMSTIDSHKTSLQGEIEVLLRACQGLPPIKRLFWELLGYNQRDEVVSLRGLVPTLRSSVIEARFFASFDNFHIYHLTLTSESLTCPILTRLYGSFSRKHRFLALIVGNAGQTDWHFAYQPDDLSLVGSRGRFTTIRIGHTEESLRRQAQNLHRLKTYDEEYEPLSLLELAAAYDGVFAKLRKQLNTSTRAKDGIEILLLEIGRYPLLTAWRERAIFEELDSISVQQTVQQGKKVKRVRVPLAGYTSRYKELYFPKLLILEPRVRGV